MEKLLPLGRYGSKVSKVGKVENGVTYLRHANGQLLVHFTVRGKVVRRVI